MLALEEVTCRGWGSHPQCFFLIKLTSLSGVVTFFCFRRWRKKRVKCQTPPKLHSLESPQCMPGCPLPQGFPRGCRNNVGILILRTHTSPHLRTEAWARVIIALVTHEGCQPNNPHVRAWMSKSATRTLYLTPLPHLCEGPSECNEAARLDLRCGGFCLHSAMEHFLPERADLGNPGNGHQLAHPPSR